MRTRKCVTFLLTFALCLIACAKRDARAEITQGYRELNSGDAPGALATFDTALLELGSNQRAERIDALLGKSLALASLDTAHAEREFLHLADRESLSLANYSSIVIALKDEGHYREALNVLEHGQAKFPAEPRFSALVQKIGELADEAAKAAAAGGDADALAMLEQLKRLGYVGNDARKR